MMSTQDPLETRTPGPRAVALRELIMRYRSTQVIYVAAKLGIADLLRDGPKSRHELAKAVGAHPRSLYRLLRALASLGIFAENENGNFELTPLAVPLQSGVPGSQRATALMRGGEWGWQPWGQLLDSIRTGKPAFDHLFGMGFYEYLDKNAEASATFSEAMSARAGLEIVSVPTAYDFSGIAKIVDVGGGYGTLIAAILKGNPEMRGVLFDLPHVIRGARSVIEKEALVDRCEPIAGDFFKSVPSGGDAYILHRVIHNWDDDHAVAILTNCRRAVVNNGRLLLLEAVIPPGNDPFPAKFLDIDQLVWGEGLERTEAEYGALFAAAGFRLTRVILIAPSTQLSLIEGVCV